MSSRKSSKAHSTENVNSDGEASNDVHEFDGASFLRGLQEISRRLKTDDIRRVDDAYPVNELKNLSADVTYLMGTFMPYAECAQLALEEVREELTYVKDRLYRKIDASNYMSEHDNKRVSFEEGQLQKKTAEICRQLALVAEAAVNATRVTIETEKALITAHEMALKTAEEARAIQADFEARRKAELAAKKNEEARLLAEQQERAAAEREAAEMKRVEDERRERLQKQVPTSSVWETWPVYTYTIEKGEFDQGVGCIVRAGADSFQENQMSCDVISAVQTTLALEEEEELISNIIRIVPSEAGMHLQTPFQLAIPHVAVRSGLREAVMKMETDEGTWKELRSMDVTLECYKDLKLVQAEVSQYTSFAVVMRAKKDFLHFSKRGGKVISSLDSRITFTCDQNAFHSNEAFVVQMQAIDTVTVNDLKKSEASCKSLLTASCIVSAEWANEKFNSTIKMTLPCPPNPVKVSKAAAARAAKEANVASRTNVTQRTTHALPVKSTKKATKSATGGEDEEEEAETETPTPSKGPNKWYMGQYGSNDDDEEDILYLVQKLQNRKWQVVHGADIQSVKMDLLLIDIAQPITQFVVLRTRTCVEPADAETMCRVIENQLRIRPAVAVLRQSNDDICDMTLHVTPHWRLARTEKWLDDHGYSEGPAASATFNLREGDSLEVKVRGNITPVRQTAPLVVNFHNQLCTSLKFYLTEVDRYRQRDYDTYRGYVQLHKRTIVTRKDALQAKRDEDDTSQDDTVKYCHILLGEQMVNIPKTDEISAEPVVRAPVMLKNESDAITLDTLRHVALQLGSEWRRVAHQLSVRRVRLQAILRNNQDHDGGVESRYDMLTTWAKSIPISVDKVAVLTKALVASGRADLAQEVEYMDNRKRHDKVPTIERYR